ncbi:hypothetical protein [Chryseobacterium bernardetii]|uniref:CdiA C-terminal domain-containing protein n=1 Tax=Chryseobacterium bernardetii TaxID=1241978 RepID=UPI0030175F7E
MFKDNWPAKKFIEIVIYTKNVEGRYKVTVTENNGKISSKFELTGQGDSKTSAKKTEIEQEVQNSINDALKDLKNPKDINSLSAKTQVNDFGFYVKQMSGKEWVETLSELGDNVWEQAALPKKYWNEDEGSKKSNVQMPALFSGVADGVIGEVTEYPQLIKLGYDVSTKSAVRQGLWNSIKNITPESIKNASVDFYEQKKANYTSDKSYIVNHTVGQDGVTVVSMAMGAGFFKKGADGLKDGIEDTGEKFIKKEADDIIEKTIPSKLPDPNALPKGTRTVISDNLDDATRVSLIRENEAADILAKKGYDIEQNPNIPNTTKNPDYKIEGKVFDCYSPYNSDKSVRNIWTEVKGKIDSKQTERVIINLKNWEGKIDDLQKQFDNYKVDDLKELMIIDKNNNINHIKLK